jgi:uncharacterized protein YceK
MDFVRPISEIFFGTLLIALSGCGTIVAYNFPSENPPSKGDYYLGVRCDIQEIKEHGSANTLAKLCAIIDTPLSAGGDTLYAPVVFFVAKPKAGSVDTNQVEQTIK